MSSACAGFFKRQDQLGSTVNLHHKGESGFGTILGGCLSMLATLFFTLFIFVQLYGWAF